MSLLCALEKRIDDIALDLLTLRTRVESTSKYASTIKSADPRTSRFSDTRAMTSGKRSMRLRSPFA